MTKFNKTNEEKSFSDNLTLKNMITVVLIVIAIVGLGIGLKTYSTKKISEFSERLKKAEKQEDYKKIIEDGCPGELLPKAEYSLAVTLFEEKNYKGSFEHFEIFVNKYPKDILYGRAVIGYVHSGFQVNSTTDFLEGCLILIKDKNLPWKNEIHFDIAGLFTKAGEKERASELYREILETRDEVWTSHAEFKLAELKKQ